MRAFALAALTTALAAAPASAAVEQFDFSMPVGHNEPIFVEGTTPAFDHLLGTLDSVEVVLTGSTNWTAIAPGAKLTFSLINSFDDEQIFTAPTPSTQKVTISLSSSARGDILGFLDIGHSDVSIDVHANDPGGVFDPFILSGTISYVYTPDVSNIGDGGGGSVPEPSTWAMMALGFVGLAFAAVRRGRASAVAA